MPSIIVLDTLSADGLAMLDAAARSGITYEVKTGLSGDALREALAAHDGVMSTSNSSVLSDGGVPYGSVVRCFASVNLSVLGPTKTPLERYTRIHALLMFLNRP